VLRLAWRNAIQNSARRPRLKEIIAQPFGGISGLAPGIAQCVSGIGRLQSEVAQPLLAVRAHRAATCQAIAAKPAKPGVAVLQELPYARPRPDWVGTRFAHWPPAGWGSHRKILRRGGGPCPGFRRAARKGFGRWNSISDRAPSRRCAMALWRRRAEPPSISFRFHDLRLLAAGRRTILFVVIRIVRAHRARERGAQNVGGEEIAPVGRYHDDLQFV
jgi:hypothetical protein